MDQGKFDKYRELLNDRDIRQSAERLALYCGIRADLKGFDCIADAVILFGTGACNGFCELYRAIAERRGLKPKSVMREMSYAVSRSLSLASRLSEFVHAELKESDLHCSLVIAYMGKMLVNSGAVRSGAPQ